jgi:FlaA1/EpsC-like NDP-sugar epimerase
MTTTSARDVTTDRATERRDGWVLVTGAGGFIGSYLVEALVSCG